uniref:Uncharacterized protein n=1 Tax=Cyprinus carpio carpio TaxID=630221 RepID=A0A9J8AIE5_CYPCA
MLLVLSEEHKEHLGFLSEVDPAVVGEFGRIAVEFLKKGSNPKIYEGAAHLGGGFPGLCAGAGILRGAQSTSAPAVFGEQEGDPTDSRQTRPQPPALPQPGVEARCAVGEPGAPAPGEAHRDAEAPPGGRCEAQRPRPADRPRHAAASHSRAGASARRAQEQPLPPHPPQHQIEPRLDCKHSCSSETSQCRFHCFICAISINWCL